MRSIRKSAAIGTVLPVTVAGVAIAQTMHDHSMGPGHMQEMTGSGQHQMGPGHMQEMMRQHQGMMPMGGNAQCIVNADLAGPRRFRSNSGGRAHTRCRPKNGLVQSRP